MNIVKFMLSAMLAVLLSVIFPTGCGDDRPQTAGQADSGGKALIVCYSWSKDKNTRRAAEMIQELTGGDLIEIEMAVPYSNNYKTVLEEARKDVDSGATPAIRPPAADVAEYDLIFVGSPIWFGTLAPPVRSYLASTDLSGKTVVPFCTHGGGGAGSFFADFTALCPDSKVQKGFSRPGEQIGGARADIADWLGKLPH